MTVLVIFFCFPVSLLAQDNEGYIPTESGFSLNSGYTYDPSHNTLFLQVSMFRLYDYERVWKHKAPESLRFKVEGSLGAASLDDKTVKMIANANILALLYLNRFELDRIKPYIEAGIGVIYTDYSVRGQDYRFNFNPQAGIGIEFKRKADTNRFATLRMHHISNGGIGSSNRGQNSIAFMFGQFF
ncbi:MAG: acyloxyacyl hydrolase [Desulfobacula sp.]|nr:acyloxyacyl hydrolase [Desulfobacula sp.]